MKIEVLIYAYLTVCLAMIGFNIICIFMFRHNDREIERGRHDFIDEIRSQLGKEQLDDTHRELLLKILSKTKGMMSFDKSLEAVSKENPEQVREYLSRLDGVFIAMTEKYSRRNELQAAYFPYIIYRYKLFFGESLPQINYALTSLLRSPSIYSRENALHALYSIGVAKDVAEGLVTVDQSGCYHHKKLITDGLMEFSGDKKELDELLWEKLSRFSLNMQLAVLDYFRFSSGEYKERMLNLLEEDNDSEIHFCAIRYFGRYPYEPAYEKLISFVENESGYRWEYTAISCFALAAYPGRRTEKLLKKKLSSRSWFVRLNAAQTLQRLGLEYADLLDIFEGGDRYAGEIMRYQFDHKRLTEKEAAK